MKCFSRLRRSSPANWRRNQSEAPEGFIYLTCGAIPSCDKLSGIPVTQKMYPEKSNDFAGFLPSVLLSRALGITTTEKMWLLTRERKSVKSRTRQWCRPQTRPLFFRLDFLSAAGRGAAQIDLPRQVNSSPLPPDSEVV